LNTPRFGPFVSTEVSPIVVARDLRKWKHQQPKHSLQGLSGRLNALVLEMVRRLIFGLYELEFSGYQQHERVVAWEGRRQTWKIVFGYCARVEHSGISCYKPCRSGVKALEAAVGWN
jgi:hypothetical protein